MAQGDGGTQEIPRTVTCSHAIGIPLEAAVAS